MYRRETIVHFLCLNITRPSALDLSGGHFDSGHGCVAVVITLLPPLQPRTKKLRPPHSRFPLLWYLAKIWQASHENIFVHALKSPLEVCALERRRWNRDGYVQIGQSLHFFHYSSLRDTAHGSRDRLQEMDCRFSLMILYSCT